DHDLLLTQGDLVLLLRNARPTGGRTQVGVGDRLTLDPDLLALHRHRHRLLLGGHVLAQPGPASLTGLGPDPQLLLGTGHGVVGGRPGHIPTDRVVGAVGQAAVGAVLAVVQAVVAVQLGLLVLREAPISLRAGGVGDLLLVVGHLDAV